VVAVKHVLPASHVVEGGVLGRRGDR
jgi:hypothetical protein